MDTLELPSAITSCIMHGRQLYYRLVFLLGMDPSLSIEIIAFWLLVEGNGEVDFLRHLNSFHGDNFLTLVGMGKQFIHGIHSNSVDLKSKYAREIRSQVIFGICFLLNNVCYKVLSDLRRKAEQGLAVHDMEESPESNYHLLCQYMKNQPHLSTSFHQYQGDYSICGGSMPSVIKRLEDMVKSMNGVQSVNVLSPDLGNMIPQQQKSTGLSISSGQIILPTSNHQDMIKMRYEAQSMNAFSMDLDFISPQQRKIFGGNIYSRSDIHGLESLFSNCTISPQIPSEWGNKSQQSFTMNMNPYVRSPVQHHSIVPQDGRTLFLTFSHGYPLTKVQINNFFMSNFGDVESLSIEDPIELRPPQYALVTFCSLETLLIVLDGRDKVQFVVEGKHLWARRYVAKSEQKGKNKAWM